MRIVLDTNVFISGIFYGGPPAIIIEAWRNSRLRVVLSLPIFEEYRRVAAIIGKKSPSVDITQIIDMVMMHSDLVSVEHGTHKVCDDPDDDKFIECAIAGACPIIVSGDNHLLRVSGYREITVFTPREFVDNHHMDI